MKIFMLLITAFSLFGREIFVEGHFIEGTKNHPKVSPGIMKIISLAETSGIPNTIAFLAYPSQAVPVNQMLGNIGVKYRVKAYDGSRYIFSVWPKIDDAHKVFAALKASKIVSYDIGLVQVNSLNAKRNGWSEIKLLTDMSYSVDKGAQILSDCIVDNGGLERAIECYNKGSHKQYSYTYYQRVFALAKK